MRDEAGALFDEVEFFSNSHLKSIEEWKALFAADLYECNPEAKERFLTDLCRYPFRVAPIGAEEAQIFSAGKPFSFCVYSRAKARACVDLLRRKDGAEVTLLPLDQMLYVLNEAYKDYLQSPFFFIDLVIAKTKYLLLALPYDDTNHLVFEANTTEYSPTTLFPSLSGAFFGFLNPVAACALPKEMREGNYFPNTIIPAVPVAEPDSDGLQIGPDFYDQVDRLDSDELRKIGVELASAVLDSDDDFISSANDSGLATAAHSQASGDVIVEALHAQVGTPEEVAPKENRVPAVVGQGPEIISSVRQRAGLFSAAVVNDMVTPSQLSEFLMFYNGPK